MKTELLTDAALHRRQLASRPVTIRRRDCDCRSCSSPRSTPDLLTARFAYAAVPTVTRIA